MATRKPACSLAILMGILASLTGCGSGDGLTAPPSTAPTVVDFEPSAQTPGAVVSTVISVVFSEDMDAATLTNSNFTLVDTSGNTVAGTVAYDGSTDTATFTPSVDLQSDSVYTVSLSTNITDAGGEALASPVTWSFATAPRMVRASTTATGIQTTASSSRPATNGNGRRVAFQSLATNLVSGDTNGAEDVFAKDTQTGTVVRVNTDASGGQSAFPAYAPRSGDDGRYIVFASADESLTANDLNGLTDVFRKDLNTGAVVRASTDAAGSQALGGASDSPAISADGRYVAFASLANNLVPSDTNGVRDVFRKDLQTGAITRISVNTAGTQGNGASSDPAISSDGRYVAFSSFASNLVGGDTNGVSDVFVRDTQTGTTLLVSVSTTGGPANLSSSKPVVSASGPSVAFESLATNLVSGDTNGLADVFLRDLGAGTTERISVSSTGSQATGGASTAPSISADGRFVAFTSMAGNLVTNDTNGLADVFVRARSAATTALISINDSATASADRASTAPTISADGRYIVFESLAANLIGSDSNGLRDIYRSYNSLFQP